MHLHPLLEKVKPGTVIKNWSDIVPLGYPDYWSMGGLLRTLASLSLYWKLTDIGWLKLDPEMVDYEVIYGYH